MNILRIDASAQAQSVTRDLTGRLVAKLDGSNVVERNLADAPIAPVDAIWTGANFTPEDSRDDTQRAALEESDALIAELEAADVIVIGLPVYNFGIPATLKAWIDKIARVGRTFRYTADGPEGLLAGKKAYLLVASGGTPVDSAMDFATPYMRHLLGFVGITDVTVIAADQRMSQPDRLDNALEAIEAVA